jgi:putative ABC transport system permease protein
MLDALWQDLRYAIRALRSSPGFAAVAILSLALGIGANSAIFSLINAVMLRSLPVSHPEELIQVTMATPQYFSNPIWEQIRDRQDVFSRIFAYGRWRFNLAKRVMRTASSRRASISIPWAYMRCSAGC